MLIFNTIRFYVIFFWFVLFYFFTNFLQADSEYDYILNGPFAGSIYYTKTKPGRWASIKHSHIPIIEIKSNYLEVSTPHEMRGFEHFIIKHIVLDKKFNIISEKSFDPSKDIPFSRHDISGYKDFIFILSVCNLHDTWLETVIIN